ncbi:MAG: hypothetical protein GEV28_22150 [Actinophytocola sp.]|uniref:hypothetical protein n=1 Tax=Actinophytocola sp. TaxID=1872138 RepID=UPI0013278A67|nr:hypothetical protein [Actinophytocola sp.]MPZ82950.1 hypothetical protein [Actinophytocola sp.]
MNGALTIADISTYLEHTGWRRRPDGWRGAAVWSHDSYDVLVPARDGMGDGELRVRELVGVLATVEQRSPDEIARDISSPLADQHWYRTFPAGVQSGFTTLKAGLHAVHSMLTVVRSATRAVIDGPHFAFAGKESATVTSLVDRVQLGQTRAGSYVFTARVPLDEEPELARRVSLQLHDAAVAARDAAAVADLSAFDDTVTAGVSAELCEGLAGLSDDGRTPFEIGFRWARGIPADLPATTVAFGEGTAELIAAAARRLRKSHQPAEVTVTGAIESLHDDPGRADRWRVRIRGQVAGTHGNRRVLWVRLPDQDAYHAALAAHQARQRVRAKGVLSRTTQRAELTTAKNDFEVLG